MVSSTTRWLIKIRRLLQRSIHCGYTGVYTESLTLDQGMRSDVMVADGLFDKAITPKHGGPVRLFVGPMYGYKSLKWLSTIEVTKQVEPGYWEVRGYDVDAWVGRSNGRSDLAT